MNEEEIGSAYNTSSSIRLPVAITMLSKTSH